MFSWTSEHTLKRHSACSNMILMLMHADKTSRLQTVISPRNLSGHGNSTRGSCKEIVEHVRYIHTYWLGNYSFPFWKQHEWFYRFLVVARKMTSCVQICTLKQYVAPIKHTCILNGNYSWYLSTNDSILQTIVTAIFPSIYMYVY